jgi:nicotinate-nucleotide adenylyltransferase
LQLGEVWGQAIKHIRVVGICLGGGNAYGGQISGGKSGGNLLRVALTLPAFASDNMSRNGRTGLQGFPKAQRGMVIGLLGGSFDPAHEGHVHITREAMKRLHLDRVWWLVSPGNPLKARPPAPMAQRMARARQVMADPHVLVTDLEVRLGTRATADSLRRLQAIYPGVRFVWIMGADNLVQFHRWNRWRDIMAMVPVAVMARPGAGLAARLSVTARAFRADEVARPEVLGLRDAPAWCFVNLPMHGASSSAIRAGGGWLGRSQEGCVSQQDEPKHVDL